MFIYTYTVIWEECVANLLYLLLLLPPHLTANHETQEKAPAISEVYSYFVGVTATKLLCNRLCEYWIILIDTVVYGTPALKLKNLANCWLPQATI